MDHQRFLPLCICLIIQLQLVFTAHKGASGVRPKFDRAEAALSRRSPLSGHHFQGDIIPTYDQVVNNFGEDVAKRTQSRTQTAEGRVQKRILGTTANFNELWSFTEDVVYVPYTVRDGDFNAEEEDLIFSAMDGLENLTNLTFQFVPRTNEIDYIEFQSGNGGCYSYIGNLRLGMQEINLDPGCVYYGIIQHEILHALGVWHEQSRPDRDSFVQINEENIIIGYEDQFSKQLPSAIDSLGSPYDYQSVMHYGSDDFGIIFTECAALSVCNRAREIRFTYSSVDYCLGVTSNTIGATVDYYLCNSVTSSGKTFLFESYLGANRIKLNSNQNLCVTLIPDAFGSYSGMLPLSLQPCEDETDFSNIVLKSQLFQVWGSSFDSDVFIKPAFDPENCFDWYEAYIYTEICGDLINSTDYTFFQTWQLISVGTTSCSNLFLACIYNETEPSQYKTTISAPSSIGQRDGISPEDADQLVTLYTNFKLSQPAGLSSIEIALIFGGSLLLVLFAIAAVFLTVEQRRRRNFTVVTTKI